MPKGFRANQWLLASAAAILLFHLPTTLAAAPPTLQSMSPANGKPGQIVNVILQGTNFVQGATSVDVSGTGVSSGGIQVVTDTFMFAALTITSAATAGDRNITVTTADGTSSLLAFTVTAVNVPTLTAITPPNGNLGQSVNVTLTGSNFVNNATFVNVTGNGVGVSAVTVTNPTTLTATLLISTGARLGNYNVSVTTAGGTSTTVGFNILAAPTLTSVNGFLIQGSTVNVVFNGSNFVFATTTAAFSGAGITVNSVTSSTSTAARTVNVTVAANAALGSRTATVTTAAGTTAPFTVYVIPNASGTISTIAGKGSIIENGTATAQTLASSRDVARDSSGNLYIASSHANKVYKLDSAGNLSTFAGTGIYGAGGDGGLAVSAQLATPHSVAVDASGNVYIAEANDIRKVAGGTISTFAGRGTVLTVGISQAGFAGDGGPAIYAQLSNPSGLAFDSHGNLFVVDAGNDRIRKITTAGIISTVAGSGTNGFFGDNGPATAASLDLDNDTVKIAFDGDNLYIPDSGNHRIRMVTSGGTISTVAGNGNEGADGDGGSALSASLGFPTAVAIDSDHNIYISDEEAFRLRKIGGDGNINTVAGDGGFGFSGDSVNALSVHVSPWGLTIDPSKNVYFYDTQSNRVRMLSTTGEVSTLAGNTGVFSGEGVPATDARLYFPLGVAVDSQDNIFIADGGNGRIRRIDHSTGSITTIAGNGSWTVTANSGPATTTALGIPFDVAVGPDGAVYVAVSDVELGGMDSRIWKIANGTASTIAGGSTSGYSGDDGLAISATLNDPQGVAVDSNGNVYIADAKNHRVRRINASDNKIVTFAGNGTQGSNGDAGPATSAQLNFPVKVAVNASGEVYIADQRNNRIRKVSNGTIGTVLPLNSQPLGVATSNGNLYVSTQSAVSRLFDSGGLLPLASGGGSTGISGDNGPAIIASVNPEGLAVTSTGSVIFVDVDNHALRQIAPLPPSSGQLAVSPASVFVRGGGLSTVTVSLTVSAGGVFPWSATVSLTTPGSENRLSLSPSSGTGFTTTILTIDQSGLAAGTYSGSITFTSPNAINGSFVVPVTFTISPAVIGTNPQTLVLNATPGGFLSTFMSVFNGGVGGNLDVSATPSVTTPNGGHWLSLPASNLTVGNSQNAGFLNPTIDSTGLANGTYVGNITLTAAGAANSPLGVLVVLNVAGQSGPPSLNSINPINGSLGQTVVVQLAGSNFVSGGTTVNVSGSDVTVTSVTVVNSGTVRATLAIAPGATISTRTISATTSAGTTGTQNFAVFGAPTLTSINPNSAGPGRSVNVNLNGTNFSQAAFAVGISGSGVSMIGMTPSTNTTFRTVTLLIAPDAAPGNRSLTVTTPAGTTAPLTFTVTGSPAYLISTIAGESNIVENGLAMAQPLAPPADIAFDSHNNLYMVIPNLNKVFKVTPLGVLTTFAGTGISGTAGDGGAATAAQLSSPRSVVVDAGDNVLIADASNHRIRKVAPNGTITTFAGTGTSGFSGDGGPAAYANLSSPSGLGMDSLGNVYIADTNNRRVRRVATNGIIATVAGNGTAGFFGDGLQAVFAQLNLDTNQPQKLAIDGAGNLYIPDTLNHRIRKVASNGIISTFAGTGTNTFGGDGGPATAAQLNSPRAVLIDVDGNVVISDGNNNRIRKVVSGTINTIVGNGAFGFNGDGPLAGGRQLSTPLGLALDGSGNLLIADQSSNRVRKVSGGSMSTVAGIGGLFTGDSLPATATQLYNPNAAAFDLSGNLLIADSRNFRIRKVDSLGSITTIIGTGVNGTSPDGTVASSAQIGFVNAMVVDALGNLYFVANNRVRKVNASDNKVNTVAGNGNAGFSGDGSSALSAQLNNPQGIAVDGDGNIYIADTNNQRVRKVTVLDGKIDTIAGNGTFGFSGDGFAAKNAQLNGPSKVAVDAAGNVYIADNNNSRTRIVSAANQNISTFSTFGGRAVMVVGSNVYVASAAGIQQIAADGTPTTIAGASFGFSGDNGPALMAAMNIVNMAMSPTGDIYVIDSSDNVVRKLTTVAPGSNLLSVSPLGINARLGNLSSTTFTETFTLNGNGAFTWQATAAVNAPANSEWLSLSATSGSDHGTSLVLTVNANGLGVGVYQGSVTITSPQAANGPVVVPVTLTVLPSILSTLGITSLSATATVGGGNPAQAGFTVTNGGSGPAFPYFAGALVLTPSGGTWFSVSPSGGTTGVGTLLLTFDITGLGSGVYNGSVVVTSAQAANSPFLIPVTLTVTPNAAPTLTLLNPSSGNPGQTVTVTLTGTNFAPAGNTVNVSGTGVTVGTVNMMSGTSLITTFTIDANATLGDRNVSVTTAQGASTTRVFTVGLIKKVRGQVTSQ